MSINQSSKAKLVEWTVVLMAFYYPTTAVFVYMNNVPSTPVNISLRLCFAILSAFAFLKGASNNPPIRKGVYWLIIFWLIYSFRLVYDVSILNIPMASRSTFLVYSMTFGSTLLPIFAIITNARYLSLSGFVSKSWLVIFVANLSISYYIFASPDALQQLFIQRLNLATEDSTSSVLNPITISLYGELLSLLSLFILTTTKVKRNVKLLHIFSISIGVINLIVGASRGPIISFLLCLFVIAYIHLQTSKRNIYYYSKIMALLILTAFGIFSKVTPTSESNSVHAFDRVEGFVDHGGGADDGGEVDPRFIIFLGAWNDFLDSPVIGKQYVTTLGNIYPHNIILEVLMATGIVGFIFFALFLYELILKIRKEIKMANRDNLSYLFIMFPVFLSGLTSGSIFLGPEVWIVCVFFLCSNMSLNTTNTLILTRT